MDDLMVTVLRGDVKSGNRTFFTLNGYFISKVYAIKDNMFLVYDPEEAHFSWVDITKYYYQGNNPEPNYFVTLYEVTSENT